MRCDWCGTREAYEGEDICYRCHRLAHPENYPTKRPHDRYPDWQHDYATDEVFRGGNQIYPLPGTATDLCSTSRRCYQCDEIRLYHAGFGVYPANAPGRLGVHRRRTIEPDYIATPSWSVFDTFFV